MDDLIERVIAARKAAEAEHVNADGSPLTEAHLAAILIAQVHAIVSPAPEKPAEPEPQS